MHQELTRSDTRIALFAEFTKPRARLPAASLDQYLARTDRGK